jgi:hypothetical protein
MPRQIGDERMLKFTGLPRRWHDAAVLRFGDT